MKSRRLGYESLKTVLQYMDVKFRFHLILRIPSIRKTEKAVPLEIDHLEFSHSCYFYVNDTKYKISSYRKYPKNIPRVHQKENEEGSVLNDLDQYGLPDYSSEDVVTPGDVVINDECILERLDFEEYYLQQLTAYEYVFAKRQNPNIDRITDPILQTFINTIERETDEQLFSQIDSLKAKTQPYICSWLNVPAPFSKWYQFTVTSGINHQKMIRPGTVKMYEVQKKIMSLFFEGRKPVPFVRNLVLAGRHTIRFPPNFKINVQNLIIPNNASKICQAIQDIIHKPLSVVEASIHSDRELDHFLIRNAQTLVVYHYKSSFRKILELPNEKVYIPDAECFLINDYVRLINDWIETERMIGSCFTFEIDDEYTGKDILMKIKSIFRVKSVGRLVKVPMNGTAQIQVSYGKRPKRYPFKAGWILTFEVATV